MTLEESYKIIEGLIFAAPYPLTSKEISEITEIDEKIVQRLIEDIAARYEESGFMLRCIAGGYQFVTRPELKEWIENWAGKLSVRPSAPALETCHHSIPTARNPQRNRTNRGVRAIVINTLLERELIMELSARRPRAAYRLWDYRQVPDGV